MQTFVLTEQQGGGWIVTRKDTNNKIGISAHSNRKLALNKVLSEIAGSKQFYITVDKETK